MAKVYDVIIIGAGLAGLTAAPYVGGSRLSTLLIEKGQDGGQIAITDEIENYPRSQLSDESGTSLIFLMSEQVKKFGAERVNDIVKSVELDDEIKKVECLKGIYECKAVIIATGAHPRPIGCNNEDLFVGKGISFCATCDASFFKDLDVYVVGGGDSAFEEAIYLTKFARHVTIIHRRDKLREVKSIQEKAFKNDKISFMWDTVVDEVGGDDVLSYMIVKNVKTNEVSRIDANQVDGMFGIFGFTGYLPNTELFLDKGFDMENGYFITYENIHSNKKGVFACGDCRVKSLRQVVTATSDGAIAAMQVEKFLND